MSVHYKYSKNVLIRLIHGQSRSKRLEKSHKFWLRIYEINSEWSWDYPTALVKSRPNKRLNVTYMISDKDDNATRIPRILSFDFEMIRFWCLEFAKLKIDAIADKNAGKNAAGIYSTGYFWRV